MRYAQIKSGQKLHMVYEAGEGKDDASIVRAGIGFVSAHGLRKAAARHLAEAGCTAHEIMAITGHKTLAEVQWYAASASGETLADAAHDKRKARTDLATRAASDLATLKIV